MIKPIVDTLGPKLDKHDYVYPYWGPLLIRCKIEQSHLNFLREATNAAKERKRLRKIKDAELEELKKDVNDIKVLLKQIIGKLDGS